MTTNLFHTPSQHRNLLTKVDITGATVLKDGCFKNRFPSTPGYQVRANGILIDNLTKKQLEGVTAVKKKPSRIPDGTIRILKERQPNQVNPKKIKHRCVALVNAQLKKMMYSFTITFPPCVNDDMAYKLFNNWLTVCRKYLKLKDYLWVREFQKIGTVHFHMLVPHFFNVQTANRAMQVALATQVRAGNLKWHVKAAKRYHGVHIGKNDKTRKVTNFARPRERRALLNYMIKYMSKGKVQNESPNHYAWHNSRAFSRMITSMALTESEARCLQIRSQLNMDTVWQNEWFTHVVWNDHSPPTWLMMHLGSVNQNILHHLETGKGKPLHVELQVDIDLQEKLHAMINNSDLPLLDSKPVYREYAKKAVIEKPKRKKMTDQEIAELHEQVKTLPTFEEWKAEQKK